MHIKKHEKQILYAYLLSEGVITIRKEWTGKHDATKLDNVKVWMLLRSMCSRGFVDLTFAWQTLYYSVKSEGIEFLRQQLGIANEKVYPKTHQPKRNVEQNTMQRGDGERRQMNRGGLRGRGGFRGGQRGGEFR